MNLEELMASTPPLQQHALIKGFQAGAASRDAEVTKWIERVNSWTRDCERLADERDQLRAQVKLLREALEYCVTQVGELATVPGIASAISSTPEQYLAEYRNKVIEECAAVCDKRAARKNDGNWANEEWGWICDANALAADEIRELKETP